MLNIRVIVTSKNSFESLSDRTAVMRSCRVVHWLAEHEELKALAAGCITEYHAYHYLGLAAAQWKLFRKEERPEGSRGWG